MFRLLAISLRRIFSRGCISNNYYGASVNQRERTIVVYVRRLETISVLNIVSQRSAANVEKQVSIIRTRILATSNL